MTLPLPVAALKEWLHSLPPEHQTEFVTEIERQREIDFLEGSLAAFMRAAWHVLEPATPLMWNWHHDVMCGYLEALHERVIRRLVLNVPPGSTKSLLASVMWPAWVWAKAPAHRFLCGSNEDGLATRDSLKMRRLVTSDWYQERWGHRVSISPDQREKTHYANSATGFRESQGVRAGVTGKRGDTIIWDDPHDAKKVESDVQRIEVLDSWDQAWSNRLNDPEQSTILLIMQRLHEEDMTGHVMAKETQKWTRVRIPMRYEGQLYDAGADIGRPELNDPRTTEGELLMPSRWSEQTVIEAEEDLGAYGTASQHQQRPSPKGGGEIQLDWFPRYKVKPADSKGIRFILVDPAGERKPGRRGKKDYTAMGVFETRADQNIYLLDGVRDRIGLIERSDLLFQWHREYRPEVVGYEQYGMQSDIAHLKDRMEREQRRFRIVELSGSLKKEDRIRRLFPRLRRHGIWFPETLNKALSTGKMVDVMAQVLDQEVKYFPVGQFDDFLDMLSRIEDLQEGGLLVFPDEGAAVELDTRPPPGGQYSWQSM